MTENLLYAAAVAAFGLVCCPSPRWQRLLLTGLAALARLSVLGTLAELAITVIWPDSVPGSLPGLVAAAAANNHLEPPVVCLLLATLVASAAAPVLAGLDFARSLAEDRAVFRTLHNALTTLEQQDIAPVPPAADSRSAAASFSSGTRHAPLPSGKRRRLGDLLG